MKKEFLKALMCLHDAGIELNKETLAAMVPDVAAEFTRRGYRNPHATAKHFCGFSEAGYHMFILRHACDSKIFE